MAQNDQSDAGQMQNIRSSHLDLWRINDVWNRGTRLGTLPVLFSRDFNPASPNCVQVSNFGVEGYLTNQELILLMEQLKAGGHPDMVIFYDGLNDAGAAGPSSGPPKPHFYIEMIKPRVEGSLAGRLDFIRESYTFQIAKAMQGVLFRRHSSQSVLNELHTKAVATLDNYEANLRLAT